MAETKIKPEQALSTARFKMGTFQKNLADASTTQAITGLGFAPKFVLFFGLVNTTRVGTWNGFDDGTSHYCLFDRSAAADVYQFHASYSIYFDTGNGGADVQNGYVSTLGTDGFTITWTKSSSPTGTADIFYTAFR